MIHELDIKFNFQEALDYYHTLEKDYQRYRWHQYDDHNNPGFIDPKNNVKNTWGWGLQTTYNDLDFVYHCDIDPHDEPPQFFKDTPLVFGFFKKVREYFKDIFRSFVFVFPPGSYIGMWLPTPPPHVKIMIPLIMNKSYTLNVHSPSKVTVNPVPGKIYLIENDYHNEWRNDGDETVVYILFSIPIEYKEYLLNLKGTIQ